MLLFCNFMSVVKMKQTLGICYFDVWGWTAESNSDFFEAGVKGHLPCVADPSKVVCGQQVDLRGLHSLLHPLQDLEKWENNSK